MKKTVLITGCSSGIGKQTALYFANKGWNVIATARNKELLDKELVHENITTHVLDVTNTTHIADIVTFIQTQYGGVDVLVNNAGYGSIGPFEAANVDDIQKQFDVNVFGVMALTRSFLPQLRAGKGTIISISSIGGRMSFPLYSLYHSTKWALEGFMESLQYELDFHDVRVKLVEPGPIQSEFNGTSQKLLKKANLNMYNEFVAKIYPIMQSAGIGGKLPIEVAKVIYRAANSRSHKLRYGVKNASILLIVRKITPDWMFRRIVKMVFKI